MQDRFAARCVGAGFNRRAAKRSSILLPAGVVFPFRVPFELRLVEVNLPQVAGAVSLSLVIKMWRRRITALPSSRHRFGMDRRTELHDGDKTVAGGSIN